MKTWDTIILGGGIIGLAVALNLRKRSASVLVIERSEPGREASWAAAGMIASCDPHTPEALQPFATASAELYPEFIRELQDESQLHIDFRRKGTIAFFAQDESPRGECMRICDEKTLSLLEPRLSFSPNAWLMPEASVNPRALLSALIKAAKHREVDFVSGTVALSVKLHNGRVSGVRTDKSEYAAATVVNSAGAWAGNIAPLSFPTRPVKGHMLSVVFQQHTHEAKSVPEPLVRHVVRAPGIYIVPRSDGELVIGSTAEEAGYDKRVDPNVIRHLHQSAANLVPEIGRGRMHEAWTGLRPGTPDNLPILGATSIPGYFAATGHYRDGIMLAPITAEIMTALVSGGQTVYDLSPFSPDRFPST